MKSKKKKKKRNFEVGRLPDFHNVKIVQDIVDENSMISCQDISLETQIPYTTVRYTLLCHLRYKG